MSTFHLSCTSNKASQKCLRVFTYEAFHPSYPVSANGRISKPPTHITYFCFHVYSEQVFTYSTMYTDAEPAHGFARFQIVLVNELIPINSTLFFLRPFGAGRCRAERASDNPHHLIAANSTSANGHDNETNAHSTQQIRNCFRFLLIHTLT